MELGQKHAANVSLILNKLQQAIAFKIDGNTKSCKKTVQEIAQLEGDADQLRRTMLRDLTTSTLEAADRESLVRFAKALDRVADWANDAARILALVPLADISSEFKSLAVMVIKRLSASDATTETKPLALSTPASNRTSSLVASSIMKGISSFSRICLSSGSLSMTTIGISFASNSRVMILPMRPYPQMM